MSDKIQRIQTPDTRAGQDLKARTRQFALRVINVYGALPKYTAAEVLGRALV